MMTKCDQISKVTDNRVLLNTIQYNKTFLRCHLQNMLWLVVHYIVFSIM